MSIVTLEAVKAAFAEANALLARLQEPAQPAATVLILPEAHIELAPGEVYAGMLLGDDGEESQHLVLLPDRAEKVTWDQAVEFAKRAGGELPTRREQSLLFANLKSHFEAAWYWSGEQHESDGAYAWGQVFYYGSQYGIHKSYEGRAVAVRRFAA
jgi:hypothetical protein